MLFFLIKIGTMEIYRMKELLINCFYRKLWLNSKIKIFENEIFLLYFNFDDSTLNISLFNSFILILFERFVLLSLMYNQYTVNHEIVCTFSMS